MAYKSEAQRQWAHTPEGMKALGGPEKVAEWDKASQHLTLPERSNPHLSKVNKVKEKPKHKKHSPGIRWV